MKLLLDTHIWIWSALEPARLHRRVAAALGNTKNEQWLSPISIWELLAAVKRGKLLLGIPAEEWIHIALRRAPLHEAPLTYEVALETNLVQMPHRDPADCFLLATARVFGLTLVTADERLIHAAAVPILSNR